LRGKRLGALKSGSAHIALAVWYKPWPIPKFPGFACLTAGMGLELFLRLLRERPSLTEREREREREEREKVSLGGPP
jgi:hypothetical protein